MSSLPVTETVLHQANVMQIDKYRETESESNLPALRGVYIRRYPDVALAMTLEDFAAIHEIVAWQLR